jgi:hypothetical protein
MKHNGDTIIPAEYDGLYYFTPDLVLGVRDKKFGIKNFEDDTVVPFKYDLIIVDYNPFGSFFEENYLQKLFVWKDQEWSLLDQFGSVIEENLSEAEVKKRLDRETIKYYDGGYSNYCLIEKRVEVSKQD